MSRVKPLLDVEQAIETLTKQTSAHQQDNGNCKFDHDKIRPESPPEPACGSAIAVAQAFANVLKGKTQDWSRGQQDSCQQHNGAGKYAGMRVEADELKKRDAGGEILRDHLSQQNHHPGGNQQTSRTSRGS